MIALVSVALSIGFLAGRAAGDPGTDAAVPAADVYVVRPGDTLWEIARMRLGADVDPRAYIEELGDANGLDGVALTPGMRLVLPAS